jgi:hypothetical protein
MAFEAILNEVDELHNVSTRLEGLADDNLPMSEGLMGVACTVRDSATVLEVLVATKLHTVNGHRLPD